MLEYDQKSWLRLLFSPRGTLLPGVGSRVLLFGVVGLLVWWLDHKSLLSVRIPVGFHEVAGLVIGLILAFRSNTAYARFWEGRTLWGGIVNASRNLARIVGQHARLDATEQKQFNAWIVAFAYAANRVLRENNDFSPVAKILSPESVVQLQTASHPALYCARHLSARIGDLTRAGRLEPILAAAAERQLSALVDCLGGSERIARTPTPLPFILLVERTAALYLLSLPFGLVGRVGWWTPLVTMAVAYLVLTIDLVGHELDNPFDDDPVDISLDSICDTIARNLLGPEEKHEGTAA